MIEMVWPMNAVAERDIEMTTDNWEKQVFSAFHMFNHHNPKLWKLDGYHEGMSTQEVYTFVSTYAPPDIVRMLPEPKDVSHD